MPGRGTLRDGVASPTECEPLVATVLQNEGIYWQVA